MEQSASKPTVLVIDDSPEIHRLLAVRLRSEDLNLIATTSSREGLELVRSGRPALVLLDLDMPGMDGFEVLRSLKDDPATVDIPVIVISGSAETEDKVTGLDLGAVDYVCKPFNLPELRARVRSALRIHQLMQLLAQRAQIDGMTGLWNRQYFDDRLADEVSSLERTDRRITVAVGDLDNFKSLNDTFGHAAGDAGLQGFARILTSQLRRTDVACRYGGEEFGLILRETDGAQARVLLERIRVELEATVWPRHPERRVTVSFGVCDRVDGDPSDPRAWVETADKALYEAKAAGRNRIVIAGGGGPARGAMPFAKAG